MNFGFLNVSRSNRGLRDQRFVGRVQAALTALCFSFLGVFAKWAYDRGLSAGELLTYRFLGASLFLWLSLFLFRRKALRLPLRQIGIYALLGVFGYALMSTTYFVALQGLSVTMAVLLLYTYPFWVTLFSHVFTEQKISRGECFSLVIAALGLVLLVGGNIEVREVTAVLLGLGSAVTYALYILLSAKFQKNAHPLITSTYVITFGFLALFAFYRPSLARIVNLTAGQLWTVIGVAVICTVFPLTLELSALQKIRGTEFSVIMMLEPVSAALWGLAFFNETLAPTQLAGAVVIIGSLIFKSVL